MSDRNQTQSVFFIELPATFCANADAIVSLIGELWKQ